MLKITLSAFFSNTSNFNNAVNPNDKEVTGVGGDVIGKKIKILSKNKNIEKLAKFKTSNFIKVQTNEVSKTDFFTFKAKIAFTQLRKTVIKISIFCYFYPKYYI